MRCPKCSIVLRPDNHNHSCYGINGAKRSVGFSMQAPTLGVVEWIGRCDDGNTILSGIIITGISHTWKGTFETWERNIFLLSPCHYETYSLSWLNIGDTVYLFHRVTSYSKDWHAVLIVSEEVINLAKEEMRLFFIARYEKRVTKYTAVVEHAKLMLIELTKKGGEN
jgi:hypothetical protein